ncbi:hypothetical protein RI844_12620 [Thalassotalea fonticola]|uniref:DUF2798 domain-containing protein n=1 Tax=Thalassotalea fonticola TaxID=3065649 RepID=A0ABZ0GKF1_9GAMM|nr:hypothetical protein RI844_12620 [Colwelliaceae bacterium S1-1]
MMALLTFLALLPLVYFIPPYVARFTSNHLWITVISVAIIVPIITYVLLPAMVKMLSSK